MKAIRVERWRATKTSGETFDVRVEVAVSDHDGETPLYAAERDLARGMACSELCEGPIEAVGQVCDGDDVPVVRVERVAEQW